MKRLFFTFLCIFLLSGVVYGEEKTLIYSTSEQITDSAVYSFSYNIPPNINSSNITSITLKAYCTDIIMFYYPDSWDYNFLIGGIGDPINKINTYNLDKNRVLKNGKITFRYGTVYPHYPSTLNMTLIIKYNAPDTPTPTQITKSPTPLGAIILTLIAIPLITLRMTKK
ncbi:hypothetical protein Mjas_07040 [Methanothermococcus sp. Ax23]|uniref:hypothetical protein n=1 Tax=Methanothermococcus sp. Ax23 TaxID=3156486 RepID=UPI003BA16939